MSNLPPPRYTLLQTVRVAFAMAWRALEESRATAKTEGPKGDQGPPGVCFDEIKSFQEDDGRVLIFQFFRGEKLLTEVRHITCTVIDRGVWRDGDFKKGDGVTWGGSFFIAQEDTKAKPGESDNWRLAVKRGRDGKDGRPGEHGKQGLEGKPGRDGRQY